MRNLMILTSLALCLFACSKESNKATTATTAETKLVEAVPAAEAATISGRVVFRGAAPKPEPLQVTSDCSVLHQAPKQSEEIVVSENGAIANTFVYVKNFSGAMAPPPVAVDLDQKGCRYEPHVTGVQVGQPMRIHNSDATFHNVHALAKANESFNFGQPNKGQVDLKFFKHPEVMVKLKCDVHTWMKSYVGVLSHPFYAVTKPDGSFSITGLPAGEWELEAWHEKLGAQTLKVTVAKKEQKIVTMTF